MLYKLISYVNKRGTFEEVGPNIDPMALTIMVPESFRGVIPDGGRIHLYGQFPLMSTGDRVNIIFMEDPEDGWEEEAIDSLHADSGTNSTPADDPGAAQGAAGPRGAVKGVADSVKQSIKRDAATVSAECPD